MIYLILSFILITLIKLEMDVFELKNTREKKL